MTNSQEQALIKIYKAMASGEIERRLAGSGLTQLARGVAENELMQRRLRAAAPRRDSVKPKAAPPVPPQMAPRSYNPAAVGFLLLVAILLLGVGWLFMWEVLPLLAVIAVLLVALSLGQAFPWIGMALGLLSLAAATAIPVAAFIYPASDPADNLLRLMFGSMAFLVLLLLGVTLFHRARVSRRDRRYAECMARPGYSAVEDDRE